MISTKTHKKWYEEFFSSVYLTKEDKEFLDEFTEQQLRDYLEKYHLDFLLRRSPTTIKDVCEYLLRGDGGN